MIKVAFYCTKDHPKYKDAVAIAEYTGAYLIDSLDSSDFLDSHDCIMAWYTWHNNLENREDYFLSILDKSNNYQKYLYIDYINNVIAGKQVFKFGYRDSLPKAMGLLKLKNQQVNILDGTAGFTIDSFAILNLNKNINITLVEQSPILYCLIKDAIARLMSSEIEEHKQLSRQMSVVNANIIDYLNENLNNQFDMIYLDPMFNKFERRTLSDAGQLVIKSKPKKNMQLLQDICFNPVNIDELLTYVLDYIKKMKHNKDQIIKLILKRSKSQAKLLAKYINYSVESKQIRYDVYI